MNMEAKPVTSYFDLDRQGLLKILAEMGEPGFRCAQIWQGIYAHLWSMPEEFSNLPGTLREGLFSKLSINNLQPIQIMFSKDRLTQKVLFKLQDGQTIETVLMRYDQRQTLCISTQVGCPIGCVFCATGQMGFKRNLSQGEIIEQVIHFARQLSHEGLKVTNVVVMGMGEPFLNYDATLNAIDVLNDSEGMNLGARRFTISTVGIIPMIERFMREGRQINLAISLHSTDAVQRSNLIPINQKYPVDDLLAACRAYTETTRRRISFEWALIQGVNDSVDNAKTLAGKLKGMLCHVNAIPLNPTTNFPGLPSRLETADKFKDCLISHGIPCTIRLRRGIEIHAGCGQLASSSNSA